MGSYRTIRIGLGEVICDKATSGIYPAITLEPSLDEPGIVGEKGPDLPLSELRDGSLVLEFHGADGAKVLIEDTLSALKQKGHDLRPFLRECIGDEWTQEAPLEQAWYWHWNGNLDDAPFVYSVLLSRTNGKCFVSNSQIAKAPWCEDLGGWWKRITEPEIPSVV